MGREAAGDIQFDYSGSLQLARRLHQLGNQADELATNRNRWAGNALETWTGRFGHDFADRVTGEITDLQRFAGEMRAAADAWALAWSRAMNEQNEIFWAREYHRREQDRNLLEKGRDWLTGSSVDAPPTPAEIPPPVAPYYAETGSFQRY